MRKHYYFQALYTQGARCTCVRVGCINVSFGSFKSIQRMQVKCVDTVEGADQLTYLYTSRRLFICVDRF